MEGLVVQAYRLVFEQESATVYRSHQVADRSTTPGDSLYVADRVDKRRPAGYPISPSITA